MSKSLLQLADSELRLTLGIMVELFTEDVQRLWLAGRLGLGHDDETMTAITYTIVP